MSIQPREIYAESHFIFDNGDIDQKDNRNCMVALVSEEGYYYYLTLATHDNDVMNNYQRYPEENYLLSKKKVFGLNRTSLVNLRSIYKGPLKGKLVVIVPDDEYKKLMKKFVSFQESHPNPLYLEMKPLLEK